MSDLPPTEDNVTPTPDAGAATAVPAGAAPAQPTAHTRISGTWIGVIIAAVVLTLLLVFILQNTRSVTISFFTAKGAMPLGVALLLAALGGIFLAALVGSLRILQIRRRVAKAPIAGGRRRRHGTGVTESGLG